MSSPAWLWMSITIGAALAQTLRNAAQRHLTQSLGTLGATLVRFLYGLPFAALWLWLVLHFTGQALPIPTLGFWAWVFVSSIAQIAATALLLRVMADRNFALGVAYSKTEVIQIALFAFVFLADPLSVPVLVAIAFGTIGVLLLSPADKKNPIRALLTGWTSRTALLGLASGTGFGLSAVGYRGAALTLDGATFLAAAACTLVAAQVLQTIMLGGWLAIRQPAVAKNVLLAWRASLFAGLMGATASGAWFTAFALEPVAHVRTLGLIELVFSLIVSQKVFRERFTRTELAGFALLAAGVAIVSLWR
ncbi:MAG: EamA/RhaT family transporter [Burkholderiales bacterium]